MAAERIDKLPPMSKAACLQEDERLDELLRARYPTPQPKAQHGHDERMDVMWWAGFHRSHSMMERVWQTGYHVAFWALIGMAVSEETCEVMLSRVRIFYLGQANPDEPWLCPEVLQSIREMDEGQHLYHRLMQDSLLAESFEEIARRDAAQEDSKKN